MLKIKRTNFNYVGSQVDFELENGIYLFPCDWNGEKYFADNGFSYKPVYEPVGEPSDEIYNIIGFEQGY